MKRSNSKLIYMLSGFVVLLAMIAAAGGLAFPSLYRDNDFVGATWFANDLVTLMVVAPLLLVTMYFFGKGKIAWRLPWVGLLGYLFYNYAFYLFGAVFNLLFLVYALLVVLAAAAILLICLDPVTWKLGSSFRPDTPVRKISVYLFLVALLLFLVEISMIGAFVFAGIIPPTIQLTGHPTSIVFALDFTIVIPLTFLASIFLWKRRPAGFLLSIVMLTKAVTYGLVLCVGSAVLAYSPAFGSWDPLIIFYFFILVGGAVGFWNLLKNLRLRDEGKLYQENQGFTKVKAGL